MKTLFIYNPFSGKTQIRNHLFDILNIFAKANYNLTVFPTTKANQASEYIKENGNKFDLIVCSGGDGTLNEVTNGLMSLEDRPLLGYIPAGSTNDFANSLGLPKNMAKAAELITSGKASKVDMGKFNSNYFVYVAAFGAFTSVSYATPQDSKNIFGHAAYLFEGLKALPNIKSYKVKVECDELNTKDNFIYGMVTNTLSVGGLYKLDKRKVKLDDGIFEVLLVKEPKDIIGLNEITACLLDSRNKSDLVYSFTTKSITFIPLEEMAWTLDGEYGGSPDLVAISSVNKAIDIISKK